MSEEVTRDQEKAFEDVLFKYRKLAEEKKDIEAKMKGLKDTVIEPFVQEHGDWRDDEGWAKMKRRSGSESYDTKAVDATCAVWASSGDRKLELAAQTLAQFRQRKADTIYLEVK